MAKKLEQTAEKLLRILKQDPDKFFPLTELSTQLNISFLSLYKCKNLLKDWGYETELEKNQGLRLKKVPDLLLALEIKEDLKTKFLGKKIYSYQVLRSTNELAFRLAEDKAKEGTLVIAEKQTLGKGRMGRSWHSPAKVGLWFSLILKPEIPPAKAPGLSLVAGVALAQAIRELTNLKAKVKWPNDCIVNGKKTAGILLELSAELDKVNFVVMGIGVNVNQKKKDFPKPLLKTATSLRMEKGKEIERIKLLKLFLSKFEKLYWEFKKTGLSFLQEEINRLSSLVGEKIEVKYGEKIIKGKALRIDENGSLVLKTKTKEETISAGEVTVL